MASIWTTQNFTFKNDLFLGDDVYSYYSDYEDFEYTDYSYLTGDYYDYNGTVYTDDYNTHNPLIKFPVPLEHIQTFSATR